MRKDIKVQSMGKINVLDSTTIDKIAAGEVVERPFSVIKELVENSIDAKATIITVEIKDGGSSLMRVTDNGVGIHKSDLTKAFLRHATSKIQTSDDLTFVKSLGFRGEALSSISAVCQVELITKTEESFIGSRVYCAGGTLQDVEEVGAPDGTTIVARNIFYNTPVRRKFLKSNVTEAGYISDLMQRIALSRPDISFKLISNGQTKFYTSGNKNMCEIVYRLYGKDVADNIIPIEKEENGIKVTGYLGKPILNRASRNFETFFVNGRYIKSNVLSRCVEEGYQEKLMQHKYPFAILHLDVSPDRVDVNVHPTKMEIRFDEPEEFSKFLINAVKEALLHKNFIPDIVENEKIPAAVKNKTERELTKVIPEPFEKNRINEGKDEVYKVKNEVSEENNKFQEVFYDEKLGNHVQAEHKYNNGNTIYNKIFGKEEEETRNNSGNTKNIIKQKEQILVRPLEQLSMFEDSFFEEQSRDEYRILGQIFDTYWLLTLKDQLYIMDQHAAHEKVKYEAFIKRLHENKVDVQNLNPPTIVTLSGKEMASFEKYQSYFSKLGFVVEEFGGNEYAIRGVPNELYGFDVKDLFLNIIDELLEFPLKGDNSVILSKIASMSCKAAVKGNTQISFDEAKQLVDKLFTLENPYHCPHGRPTVISMSKYEIEKKFKRTGV